jgi:2,3,4,5-tetrahydropyridine-2,6-dicarboxylate N-succinyltransferase
MKKYISQVEEIWQSKDKILSNKYSETHKNAKKIVQIIINDLDKGRIRVAEKKDGQWQTNDWAKKAILLSFILHDSVTYTNGINNYFDKIPPKFSEMWDEADFLREQIRLCPGSFVRKGSFIGKNSVVMPSFINIGAYIDENSMIDTWATIGSCAQIGKNCHISGGAGIGGVLEPISANPVIIEDNCFIGARSEIAEGVIVEEGSVISMGVFIGASTKIVDRMTGAIHYGRVPAYSVVVPGTIPAHEPNLPSLYCAVIVKKVDENTRSKVSINELLRF